SYSADPSLRLSGTAAFLAGRPELPGFARSLLPVVQRGAEPAQRLAPLGRDELEVELAIGDLEERAIGGEQLGLGALDLHPVDVVEVAPHQLGLGVELVGDV